MFGSMTSSVTNWLGNITGGEEKKEGATVSNSGKSLKDEQEKEVEAPVKEKVDQAQRENENDSLIDKGEIIKGGNPPAAATAEGEHGEEEKESSIDLDEVSAKAINTAKEWGSYLLNFGKAATEQVSKTAKQIKDVVEEKTILGDFAKEQEKFVHEKREKAKLSEAAVPPWVGYNEEDSMKQQILALSQDKRNFLRNPPTGVQFQFDFEASFPVALATLPEDPNLKEMRFELVPKFVTEENFWRNYFYRVSLIKQSTQLTSLAQQSGSTGESSSSSRRSSTGTENEKETKKSVRQEPEELPTGSPPDHEFVSDAFQDNNINEDDLKMEMEQLGMKEQKMEETSEKPAAADDIPEWEKELQAELQEYEVVDDGKAFDDELDEEILQEIEQEASMK